MTFRPITIRTTDARRRASPAKRAVKVIQGLQQKLSPLRRKMRDEVEVTAPMRPAPRGPAVDSDIGSDRSNERPREFSGEGGPFDDHSVPTTAPSTPSTVQGAPKANAASDDLVSEGNLAKSVLAASHDADVFVAS